VPTSIFEVRVLNYRYSINMVEERRYWQYCQYCF